MGQELSTFRSILKQKKNKTMDDSKIKFITKENENGESSSKSTNNNDDSDNIIHNNNENHQHFENIYNISTEQVSDNCERTDNNCNNLKEEIDNESTNNSIEIKINDDVVVEKSKYKLRKKRTQDVGSRTKKKKNHWVLRFNCARLKSGSSTSSGCSETEIPDKDKETDSCICTRYCRTESQNSTYDNLTSILPVFVPRQHTDELERRQSQVNLENLEPDEGDSSRRSDTENNSILSQNAEPVIDLSRFNPEDYPIEDCDERARLERAREIAEGVDPPPGFSPKHQIELVCHSDISIDNLTALFQSALSLSALSQIDIPKSVHTQIDYIHCLVPDLLQITSSSFYWGKMDRYEAERVLENKQEGTFLLRDSAQEEYLFSVSFRKYNRSLHARIEQWNHKFSFDSHDPGVFASNTVCGLLEHYKDPTCVMFFEPMLTIPLHRNFPFSLQHICRAAICDRLNYDSINLLKLPKSLKTYLKEYHYKQRVRVRKFDSEP